MIRTTVSLFALAGSVLAQAPTPTAALRLVEPAAVRTAAAPSRAIDLVICLDVSGSMDGLLNAARQNLWAVVNDLATLRPQPDLRVALLTFGCPAYGQESGFVAVQTELTNDLDLVSQKLFALKTNGGDEYVARVVHRALEVLDWSKDPKALKLIFVAGNEAATQDPLFDAFAESKAAIARGILVNTIYCGDPKHELANAWRQVARSADGNFASIEQDQAVVIATPFDKTLGDLSARLNTTYVPYGKQAGTWVQNQLEQDKNASDLNGANVAQRCQTKAGALYCNSQWDLVDACKDANFDLAKVTKEDLAPDLQKLSIDQLKAHVAKKAAERAAIQKQVAELGKKRDAFVEGERKKLGDAGKKLFELAVLESVRSQAKSRGFERKVEGTSEAKPRIDVD